MIFDMRGGSLDTAKLPEFFREVLQKNLTDPSSSQIIDLGRGEAVEVHMDPERRVPKIGHAEGRPWFSGFLLTNHTSGSRLLLPKGTLVWVGYDRNGNPVVRQQEEPVEDYHVRGTD